MPGVSCWPGAWRERAALPRMTAVPETTLALANMPAAGCDSRGAALAGDADRGARRCCHGRDHGPGSASRPCSSALDMCSDGRAGRTSQPSRPLGYESGAIDDEPAAIRSPQRAGPWCCGGGVRLSAPALAADRVRDHRLRPPPECPANTHPGSQGRSQARGCRPAERRRPDAGGRYRAEPGQRERDLLPPPGAGPGANAAVAVSYSLSFITPVGAIAGLFGGSGFGSPVTLTAQGVVPCET